MVQAPPPGTPLSLLVLRIQVLFLHLFPVQFLPTKLAHPPPLSWALFVWMGTTTHLISSHTLVVSSLLLFLPWGYRTVPPWRLLSPHQHQETPNQFPHGILLPRNPWPPSITLSLQLLPRLAPCTDTSMPRLLFRNVLSRILLLLTSGWNFRRLLPLHMRCQLLQPSMLSNPWFSMVCPITQSARWEFQMSLGCRWSLGLGKKFMTWDWMTWSSHLEVGKHGVRLRVRPQDCFASGLSLVHSTWC